MPYKHISDDKCIISGSLGDPKQSWSCYEPICYWTDEKCDHKETQGCKYRIWIEGDKEIIQKYIEEKRHEDEH